MFPSLQQIAIYESSIQSAQLCDKTGKENLQDILGMLVRQMNRLENSVASQKQSQTIQQTETLNLEKLTA